MNTDMNIFEKASRLRLRFNVGTLSNLTVEDLWSLPLTGNKGNSLDALAINLNKKLTDETPKSYVTKTDTKTDTTTQLSFDIVKHIIDVRLAEQAAQQDKMIKSAKRAQLEQLKSQKQMAELENLTIEEIDQRLKELDE